ncbi:hypothetical protein ACQP2T_20700 [Nonomuraea sp. CA-143628]|uniref:hypothetical protein n=1 Tax=Nonomuraea sp. CA-143628 TaxID=3239997 RepID=UPI003D8C4239
MSGRFAPVPPTVGPASEITLLALHTATTIGAQVARIAARLWGLAHLDHAAEQVAEHLIARAVEITGYPDPNLRYSDIDLTTLAVVSIRVHRRADALIIDVWDTDPTPPDTTPLDQRMAAVGALARRWNSYPAPRGGKVIWAEIAPEDQHVGQEPHSRNAAANGVPHPESPASAYPCHTAQPPELPVTTGLDMAPFW